MVDTADEHSVHSRSISATPYPDSVEDLEDKSAQVRKALLSDQVLRQYEE